LEDGVRGRVQPRVKLRDRAKLRVKVLTNTNPRLGSLGYHHRSSNRPARDNKADRVLLSTNRLSQGKDKDKELHLRKLEMDLRRNLPHLLARMVLVVRQVQVVFHRQCKISSLRCSTLYPKVELGGLIQLLLVDEGRAELLPTPVQDRTWVQVKTKAKVKPFPILWEGKEFLNKPPVKLILLQTLILLPISFLPGTNS
jgi:hypothetical protein